MTLRTIRPLYLISPIHRYVFRLLAMLGACGALGVGRTSALELHREPESKFDLTLTGRLTGVEAGEKRYVRWTELRALPTTKLKLNGEFIPGEQEVTVLFLDELWKQLPRGDGADVLLTTSADGYAAVFPREFITNYRPFLVLEINGHGPTDWPPPGLKFNPAPYTIAVSASVVPAVAQLLDARHKDPWAVTTIEVASFAERFRGSYTGAWASVTPLAAQGRDIWINSCACCHAGPEKTFGGTKSGQSFPLVQAIAGFNPTLFRTYVRAPKSVNPDAKMEAHTYTDAQLDALIAFIMVGK